MPVWNAIDRIFTAALLTSGALVSPGLAPIWIKSASAATGQPFSMTDRNGDIDEKNRAACLNGVVDKLGIWREGNP